MAEQATGGETRQLRRLLPAPAKPVSTPTPSPRRLRNLVSGACNPCRQHKTKCSGERPACLRCVKRHLQCRYVTLPGETAAQARNRDYHELQDRAATNDEFLDLLETLPSQDSEALLKRFRAGKDIPSLLSEVGAGNLLLQMAVSPETRYRYEFPYRSELPEHYILDNPYLNSVIYEAASLHAADQRSSRSRHLSPSTVERLASDERWSPYLKPFHATEVIDTRLSNVRPSSWTAVCHDDVLMRDLLGVFFRCEYQFTAAFQKDLFLEDMAAQGSDFCSSLLVNVMLAYSCVCHSKFKDRAEYWNPHTLTYRFFAEAKRLWELEATKPRITTIQTGILFSVYYNLSGLDEIGQPYRIQAVALAHKLRLFDSAAADGQSDRIRQGRAFTAWALYNWETLVAFSFMHSPLIKNTPDWRLPDPSKDAHWYGEIWLKYPLSHTLWPSSFGNVFSARCQFRVIMNEACQVAYSNSSGIGLEKAKELYSRLKGWYDGLTGPLLPRAIVLPGHLQLHIYHHHLILTVFEPLLNEETDQEPHPQQIVAQSRKHLETLIRLYYLRHGYEAMDLFIVIPLMLSGYHCLDAIDDQTPAPRLEDLRSTLILIAKGLYNQRRNHYLAEALFRVIRGRMRPQEAALLREAVDLRVDESSEKRAMVQAVRSHWPVSVVKKKEDMDSHILSNLVENYAQLNVEDGP